MKNSPFMAPSMPSKSGLWHPTQYCRYAFWPRCACASVYTASHTVFPKREPLKNHRDAKAQRKKWGLRGKWGLTPPAKQDSTGPMESRFVRGVRPHFPRRPHFFSRTPVFFTYVAFLNSLKRMALSVLPPTLNFTKRNPRLSYGYSVELSSVLSTGVPSSIPRTSRIVLRSPLFSNFCSFGSATFFANAWLTSILRALPVILKV